MKRRSNGKIVEPLALKLSTAAVEFLEVSVCTKSTTLKSKKLPKPQNEAATKYPHDRLVTMDTFIATLSSFGEHVKHIRIMNGNSLVLPAIRQNCKNVKRLELLDGEGSAPLQHFKELTEMKLPNVRMEMNAFQNCLKNNPHLESLEYDYFWYHDQMRDLLKLLPKLNFLRLRVYAWKLPYPDYEETDKLLQSIISSVVLTKLAIQFKLNGEKEAVAYRNYLLERLSEKVNLVELEVTMVMNLNIYPLIGLFENLEVLSLTHTGMSKHKFPKSAILSPRLKRLHLKGMIISATEFWWIVEKLPKLEELHIGTTNAQQHPWLHNETSITEITKKLDARPGGRTLKIFFSYGNAVANVRRDGKLEMINYGAADSETEPLRIVIECEEAKIKCEELNE